MQARFDAQVHLLRCSRRGGVERSGYLAVIEAEQTSEAFASSDRPITIGTLAGDEQLAPHALVVSLEIVMLDSAAEPAEA